jgi:hypothetical protein
LGGKVEGEGKLVGYSDAGYSINKNNGKGRTGALIKFNNGSIYWKSKLQTVVTRSTAEAELIASEHVANVLKWGTGLLRDIGFKMDQAARLWTDNKPALFIMDDMSSIRNVRNIAVTAHSLKEMKAREVIDPKYLQTTEMIADVLTKPLGISLLSLLRVWD